jgi:hypothetical protein
MSLLASIFKELMITKWNNFPFGPLARELWSCKGSKDYSRTIQQLEHMIIEQLRHGIGM